MLSYYVIKRFSQGDQNAFKEIYYHYYNAAYQLARRIVKQRDIAEDVVAHVFTALWLNRENFEKSEVLRSYIKICIRNKALNEKRFLVKRIQKRERIENSFYKEYKEANIDPEKQFLLFEDTEILNLIYSLADQYLNKTSKMVFYMYYSDGESAVAIAEHLKVRRQTINYRLLHSVKILRKRVSCLPYKIIRK